MKHDTFANLMAVVLKQSDLMKWRGEGEKMKISTTKSSGQVKSIHFYLNISFLPLLVLGNGLNRC